MLATLTVVNANDAGGGSLRRAIQHANATLEADTIEFSSELDGLTISLTTGDLGVTSAIHIDASALQSSLTIDASTSDATPNVKDGQGTRVFAVGGMEADLTLTSLTLTGGDVAGRGGAIFSARPLQLNDTRILLSHADVAGGGIFSTGTVRLADSVVTGNTTLGVGGGIAIEEASLHLDRTFLTANISGESGGGAHVDGREVTFAVTNSYIDGNISRSGGGGGLRVSTYQGRIEITDTRISSNSAARSGGGAVVTGMNSGVAFSGSMVTGNSAGGSGGGVSNPANQFSSMNITETVISGNSAAGIGGGVVTTAGLDMEDSTLSGNTAGERGGGLALARGYRTSASVYQSTISGNSAVDGGGISALSYTYLNVRKSTLSLNVASGDGGAAHVTNLASSVEFIESTISGNRANGEGGALWLRLGHSYLEPSRFELSRSTIANNVADFDDDGEGRAAGIFVERARKFSSETIEHNIITGSVSGSGDTPGWDIIADDPLPTNQNLIGQVGANVSLEDNLVESNPLLGRLVDNGGSTFTHALLEGSPAIDAGPESIDDAIESDQRGAPFGRLRDGDGDGQIRLDLGAFEVQGVNEPPVANAGDDLSVRATFVATLDGSRSSDPDGGPSALSYVWGVVSGPDEAELSQPSGGPTAMFATDVAGDYTLRLTVSDGLAIATDDVLVTVIANQVPVADATLSETAGNIGDVIILDGTRSSDADGDDLRFAWRFLEQPDGSAVEINDANTSSASFIPTHAGVYRAELVVNDRMDESSPVEVVTQIENVDTGPGGEWYNAALPTDVDGDTFITPVDALLVINELNDRVFSDPAMGRLVSLDRPGDLPFLDVTNNGFIDPVDALTVINMLPNNRTNRTTGGTVSSGGVSTGGSVSSFESIFANADFLDSLYDWHQNESLLPWPDPSAWS